MSTSKCPMSTSKCGPGRGGVFTR